MSLIRFYLQDNKYSANTLANYCDNRWIFTKPLMPVVFRGIVVRVHQVKHWKPYSCAFHPCFTYFL